MSRPQKIMPPVEGTLTSVLTAIADKGKRTTTKACVQLSAEQRKAKPEKA